MKFFEFSEVILAIVSSFIFGVLYGGIYSSFNVVTEGIIKILKIPQVVFLSSNIKALQDNKYQTNKSVIIINVCDFLFFLFFGLGYILLTYIMLDGIFRFYMFVFCILGFWISQKTLGTIFERILAFVFNFFYRFLVNISYVLIFPLKLFFRLLIIPMFNYVVLFKRKRTSKVLLSKKMHKIKFLFEKSILF